MELQKEKETKNIKKNTPGIKGRKAQIASLILAIIDTFDNNTKPEKNK